MDVKTRVRICRILIKLSEHPEQAKRMQVKDTSYYKNNTDKNKI